MTTFITVLMVIAAIILNVAVLLQPTKSGAMSPLGGSSQSVFGSTGGTTFLFRTTMWSAAFIMLAALYMARIRVQEGRSSVIDLTAPRAPVTPAPPAVPTAPNTPNTGAATTGASQNNPAAPSAPSPSTVPTNPAKH